MSRRGTPQQRSAAAARNVAARGATIKRARQNIPRVKGTARDYGGPASPPREGATPSQKIHLRLGGAPVSPTRPTRPSATATPTRPTTQGSRTAQKQKALFALAEQYRAGEVSFQDLAKMVRTIYGL